MPTPVGEMLAIASSHGLCALEYASQKRLSLLSARLKRFYEAPAAQTGDEARFLTIRRWLDAYFHADFTHLPAVDLDPCGSDFERAVWRALFNLLPGRTASYGEFARALGRPRSTRAVAAAIGRNPLAIIVPCHRVVGQGGNLTGYSGGLQNKRWLLDHELQTVEKSN